MEGVKFKREMISSDVTKLFYLYEYV